MCDGCDDHLGNAVAVPDGEGDLAQVDERDKHFTAVVCVDCSWSVGQRDAVLCGDS